MAPAARVQIPVSFPGTSSASHLNPWPHFQTALEVPPSQRTPAQIGCIRELLKTVRAYSGMGLSVLDFLAAHVELMVVWDAVELPRTGTQQQPCMLHVTQLLHASD